MLRSLARRAPLSCNEAGSPQATGNQRVPLTLSPLLYDDSLQDGATSGNDVTRRKPRRRGLAGLEEGGRVEVRELLV